jgi:hypothetical protein
VPDVIPAIVLTTQLETGFAPAAPRVRFPSALEQLQCRPDRQEKLEQARSERLKPMMPVECGCGVILGIHQNG